MRNIFLSAKNLRVSNENDFWFYGRNLALSVMTELQISKYISKNNKADYVIPKPLIWLKMFYIDRVGIHQPRSFTGLER